MRSPDLSQSNRRRRGRGSRGGRKSGGGQNRHQKQQGLHNQTQDYGAIDQEDPQTFWARSNARLGIDPGDSQNGQSKKGRPPVEFSCAVCGVWVLLDKWPKERHDVRCDRCKGAVTGLLQGDELEIAQGLRREHEPEIHGRYEGLPEMTDEDKAAVAEMRTHADMMGNGRVGNRRRGSGSNRKRRRSGGGKNQGQGGQQSKSSSGGRRRRRRRGGSGGGGGGGGQGAAES